MSLSGDQSLSNANPNSNYYSFNPRKVNEGKVPHPSEIISGSDHILVVDSRDRNLNIYPNPAEYCMLFPEKYKNVTSIELKGSIIPKTEYNVNTENNKIVFNLQDFITEIQIVNRGMGYVDGVYTTPDIQITQPAITGGTQAEITVTISSGRVIDATITTPGTGYLRGFYGSSLEEPSSGFYRSSSASVISDIPRDNSATKFEKLQLNVTVGNEIVAELNIGQYDFAHPNDSESGLCREVTRALQAATQEAIDDNILVPVVGGPQTGEEYFPYSAADDATGSCWLWTPNPNASENSNVAIQRGTPSGGYTQDLFLELLWGQSVEQNSTAIRLLGMGTTPSTSQGLPDQPLDKTTGTTSDLVAWTSIPIRGSNNYSLVDFPKYTILSVGASPDTHVDRIESIGETLNKGFATLVFDANGQDVIWRSPSSTTPVDGTGPSSYDTLLLKPGTLKAIKGPDFDAKIINFGTSPISELKSLSVRFQKANGDLYDFHGEDHLLIFQISARDINSGNRW